MEADKIRVRDNKLLKSEKSWRRARLGAVILAVVWLCLLTPYIASESPPISEGKEALFSLIGGFLFWIVIVDWLNMRLRHIDSIKYYRKEIETGALPK